MSTHYTSKRTFNRRHELPISHNDNDKIKGKILSSSHSTFFFSSASSNVAHVFQNS